MSALPRVDVPKAVKNNLRLVLMQLADLHGEDPALRISEYGNGEDLAIHAEGIDRGDAVFFADQYRIIDADLVSVIYYGIFEVDCDSDDLQRLARALVAQALQ